VIRDASPTDLPAITALYGREVLTGTATFELDPPSLAEMTTRFDAVRAKGLPWLVAEIDGTFAGYAVGRALLTALIERSRTLGLRHVIGAISDSATSEASIALHDRLGFRRVGAYAQVGWKFDRWIDVHLMQLDLDPDGSPPTAPGLDLGGALA